VGWGETLVAAGEGKGRSRAEGQSQTLPLLIDNLYFLSPLPTFLHSLHTWATWFSSSVFSLSRFYVRGVTKAVVNKPNSVSRCSPTVNHSWAHNCILQGHELALSRPGVRSYVNSAPAVFKWP